MPDRYLGRTAGTSPVIRYVGTGALSCVYDAVTSRWKSPSRSRSSAPSTPDPSAPRRVAAGRPPPRPVGGFPVSCPSATSPGRRGRLCGPRRPPCSVLARGYAFSRRHRHTALRRRRLVRRLLAKVPAERFAGAQRVVNALAALPSAPSAARAPLALARTPSRIPRQNTCHRPLWPVLAVFAVQVDELGIWGRLWGRRHLPSSPTAAAGGRPERDSSRSPTASNSWGQATSPMDSALSAVHAVPTWARRPKPRTGQVTPLTDDSAQRYLVNRLVGIGSLGTSPSRRRSRCAR